MKGKHHIVVQNDRVKYAFDICRNITVIRGDSATGKTSLLNLLQEYAVRGKGSGVMLQSDVPCAVYSLGESQWEAYLAIMGRSIIFIDEDYRFVYSKEFAKRIQHTDHYYVIISRKPLRNLPYSVREVYGIRTSGKYHYPEQVYNELYPLYREEQFCGKPVLIITEDEKAGFEFFRHAFQKVKCISAGGNTSVVPTVCACIRENAVIVIADGAAFGPFIDELLKVGEANDGVGVYLPESFEWLLLRSGILKNAEIEKVLAHPEDYIDSQEYFTWEQFFTEYLQKQTRIEGQTRYMQYKKDRLPEFFLTERAMRMILDVLPEELRSWLSAESA